MGFIGYNQLGDDKERSGPAAISKEERKQEKRVDRKDAVKRELGSARRSAAERSASPGEEKRRRASREQRHNERERERQENRDLRERPAYSLFGDKMEGPKRKVDDKRHTAKGALYIKRDSKASRVEHHTQRRLLRADDKQIHGAGSMEKKPSGKNTSLNIELDWSLTQTLTPTIDIADLHKANTVSSQPKEIKPKVRDLGPKQRCPKLAEFNKRHGFI